MRIGDGIYWYPWQGRGNNCNTVLLKGKKIVLIDPGHIYNEFRESCLELLARQVAADGFDLKEVELILCTHGHPDHVEAAGILRENSGAQMAIHREDEFILEALEQRYAGASGGKQMPSLKPDFFLQEGELELGRDQPDRLRVVHTPGHSPGSCCFYLPSGKALISGDTVFENSIGRTDLPGGDMAAMGQSVDKLARLAEVELLLPGHMGHISGADNVQGNFTRIKQAFFGR